MRRMTPKGQGPTEWQAISWDEAIGEIASHMRRIRDEDGAEQVAFSVTTPSGTHIQDSISWIERFIRSYGSPNTIYATEICNWHKDHAKKLTFGADIGTPDFANTDCVLLWGNNPAATWLARVGEVQKALKRGAKLIVVDPRPTLFARRADNWLRLRPGTDQAVALGLANLVLEQNSYDHAFTREWTNATFLVRKDTGRFLRESDLTAGGSQHVLLAAGAAEGDFVRYDAENGRWLDDATAALLFSERHVETREGTQACTSALEIFATAARAWSPARVADATGVPEDMLRRTAVTLTQAKSVAYYAWNGIGQNVTATQTDRALSILYSLLGHYGARGGNVPGGAAQFNDISGLDLISAQQRHKALGLDGRPLGPGLNCWVTARDVYTAVLERKPYPVRMLFSFGTNLLAAQPDSDRAEATFKALEFHFHAYFCINSTAEFADIVLPVSTSWEREGLRTGFDCSLEGLRRVQMRPPVIAPLGEARSDTDIVMALAERLGLSEVMFDCSVDKGNAHILAAAGLTLETVKANPSGVTLDQSVPIKAYVESGFPTPTRRVEIYSEQLHAHAYDPVPRLDEAMLPTTPGPEFPLRLSSAKTVSFCHSQHRNLPSLRRLTPFPPLELGAAVAEARGIHDGDWVEVRTPKGVFVAKAKMTKDIEPDTVFAQHGWWVDPNDPEHRGPLAANINRTVSTDRADPISGSIPLRSSWCEVRRL